MIKDYEAPTDVELDDEDDVGDYEFDQKGYDAYMNDENDEGDFVYDSIGYTRKQVSTGSLGKQLATAVEKYVKNKKVPQDEKDELLSLSAKNDELEFEVKALDQKIFELSQVYRENVIVVTKYKRALESAATEKSLSENAEDFETSSGTNDEPAHVSEAKTIANNTFAKLINLEEEREVFNGERKHAIAKIGSIASHEENAHYAKLLEVIDHKIFGIETIIEITQTQTSEAEEEAFKESLKKFNEFAEGKLSIDDVTGEEESDEDYDGVELNNLTEGEYSLDEMVAMDHDHGEILDFDALSESFSVRAKKYKDSRDSHPAGKGLIEPVTSDVIEPLDNDESALTSEKITDREEREVDNTTKNIFSSPIFDEMAKRLGLDF